jgi:hypothetical protein
MIYARTPIVLLILATTLAGCAGRGVGTKHITQQAAAKIQPASKTPVVKNKSLGIKQLRQLSKLPRNSYRIDQSKSLEIAVSKYGYTRFSIEDERITDVFVYPQEDIQVRIHDQGYLVVVPKQLQESVEVGGSTSQEKIYATITGEHGTTQDFSLRFTGKSPEPVRFVKSNLGPINLSKGD